MHYSASRGKNVREIGNNGGFAANYWGLVAGCAPKYWGLSPWGVGPHNVGAYVRMMSMKH